MADDRTRERLARRRRGRSLGAGLTGIVAGVVLKMVFGTQPVGSFLDRFQLVGEVLPAVKLWLDARPAFTGWLAGPVMLGLLFLGCASLPPVRRILERLWPGPPPFVRSDLHEAKQRDRMLSLEGPPLRLVGREDVLADVNLLLVKDRTPFAWRGLNGPSGIGKSRLALEWLGCAEAAGWDVGLVDPDDFALVATWKARRPTALVVDEASRDWDGRLGPLLAELSGAGTAERLVRVLVVDQVRSGIDVAGGEARDRVRAGGVGAPLRLNGLSDSAIGELREASGRTDMEIAHLVRESAGRPRSALILLNSPGALGYVDAIGQWVDRFVPGLGDPGASLPPGFVGALFLSALAGPMETDVARELFGPLNAETLVRFYQSEDCESLERILPPVRPDDLAQELLLRIYPRLDAKLREAAVDRMIEFAPAHVEARLGAIWRDRPDLTVVDPSSGPAATLHRIQQRFDAMCVDRVAATRSAAQNAVMALRAPDLEIRDVELILAQLEDAAAARPHDEIVLLALVRGLMEAIDLYSDAGALDRVEGCGARIMALAAEAFRPRNLDIGLDLMAAAGNAGLAYGQIFDFDNFELWMHRLHAIMADFDLNGQELAKLMVAKASSNAILYYGEVGRFDDLERWRERGIGDGDRDPGTSQERRAIQASGLVSAFYSYGNACRVDDLERWEKILDRMVSDERDGSSHDIRLDEMKAAVNAIGAYGAVGDFVSLERWGTRVTTLAEDPRFADSVELRLEEAKAVVNAIVSFGRAGALADMERWGRHLIALADDERFRAVYEMRSHEVVGVSNVIQMLARHDAIDQVPAWEARLLEYMDNEPFRSDPSIRAREVQCAVDLIAGYGRSESFLEIQQWGARLKIIAADEKLIVADGIASGLATAASNALVAYTNAGRYDWPPAQQWKNLLADLAARFVDQLAIQEMANAFGVSKVSQIIDERR